METFIFLYSFLDGELHPKKSKIDNQNDIKKDREVFVDGQKLDTYGIKLEKEIKILSRKGPKYDKKINKMKKLLRTHKGI